MENAIDDEENEKIENEYAAQQENVNQSVEQSLIEKHPVEATLTYDL